MSVNRLVVVLQYLQHIANVRCVLEVSIVNALTNAIIFRSIIYMHSWALTCT
jgi:hypothetical protein